MQVLSCPRSVSLIAAPLLKDAGACTPERGFDRAGTWNASGTAARQVRGFSLVELMVGLAVAAVLLVIAVPSFRNLTLSNRLTTTANDIVGAIYTARMEAIKLNGSTQLCSDSTTSNTTGTTDTLGNACTTQTGAVWASVGGTATQIRASTVGISTPLQLSGDLTALRFTSAGLGQAVGVPGPYNGLVVDICTAGMSNTNNHRQIWMTTGSTLETRTTSGACP